MHVQTKQLGRFLLAVLAMVGLSTTAVAADVVDVRIGTHPTYTRVVFELDAASGYSVERQLAEDGVAQLLITMDAGSAPRSIDSRSVMVERVAVQDGAERATAHIRLRHKPARLKELILTNPPRLVFDFVYPDSIIASRKAAAEKLAAAAAAKAKPAPTAVPAPTATTRTQVSSATSKPRAQAPTATANIETQVRDAAAKRVAAKPTATPTAMPSPNVVAKTTPAPRPTLQPAVDPTPSPAPAPKPTATPTAKPTADAAAETVAKTSPSAKAGELAESVLEPAVAAPIANAAKPEAEDAQVAGQEPSDDGAADSDVTEAIRKAAGRERDAAAKTEPVAKARQKPSSAMPAAPAAPVQEQGLDWVMVGGVAAGALALFVAFFVWNRRRALPNDFDVTALAEGPESDDETGSQGFAMGTEPEEIAVGFEEPQSSKTLFDEPVADAVQAEPATTEGLGLFDDDESDKETHAMDLDNPDLPMDRTASEMPTQMGMSVDVPSAGGGDVSAMLRDFESRLVKLETQLDEANDARERLERQVTAQAEELRVQRAAIARTQRALRGMNRGEGEQVTEPAIREPNS